VILDTVILSSIKPDTTPENSDSKIQIPPIMLPVVRLIDPLSKLPTVSPVSPGDVTNLLRNTSLISFTHFNANAGILATNLCALAPGLWELDMTLETIIMNPVAATIYQITIVYGTVAPANEAAILGTLVGLNGINMARNRKMELLLRNPGFFALQNTAALGVGVLLHGAGTFHAIRRQ
jgi:hypothetical protein